MKKDVLKS